MGVLNPYDAITNRILGFIIYKKIFFSRNYLKHK